MYPMGPFNQVPMAFQFPMQHPPAPIYHSQYGAFNATMPTPYQQPPIPRGQSLPPSSRQNPPPTTVYVSKPTRRQEQYPPVVPTQPVQHNRPHRSKGKKHKQKNVSSSGITEQALYSDKERNNQKTAEGASRSPSPVIEDNLKQEEVTQPATATATSNNNTNAQEHTSEIIENTNEDVSQANNTLVVEEPNHAEEKRKRKSRSKKKKHHRQEYYEFPNNNNAYFVQPATIHGELPPYMRVHQQPLYNSYNKVFEESIRRGDIFHKQAKRSTRLPPEAKHKLLPHEDDQKKAYPVVGYLQQPFHPYQPYTARPNFYGPAVPYNARQQWQNSPGVNVSEEQTIDRLRDHIHSLEHKLTKLQKKLRKAKLRNANNEPSTNDEHKRSNLHVKGDATGSPRQTPVIVELNGTVTDNVQEPSSKKHRHRTESDQSGKQVHQNIVQQSGVVPAQNLSPNNIPQQIQSPRQQPMADIQEHSRSDANRLTDTNGKVALSPKSAREETAARLAHAAVAHVNARQQYPPPPPIHQQYVHQQGIPATQEQQQLRGQFSHLPTNGLVQHANEPYPQQRNVANLNYNQSNNNELSDNGTERSNRSAEQILDAFERVYLKDGKSTTQIKVKYIPEDNNSNNNQQRNTNNDSRHRSASRSSQNSSSSSSSSSSTWSSSSDESSEEQTNPAKP